MEMTNEQNIPNDKEWKTTLPLDPSSAGLRNRNWKRFLRGPDPMLLDELYVPGLAEAVRYDRCCAYFSSSVLAAAAMGFGKLIQRLIVMGDKAPHPAIRLVVNEELAADDVKAMIETGDTSTLEEALKKRLKSPKDILEKRRLAMLGWLVKEGLLEVRVGIMRQGTGVVHAKFGIMTDPVGDSIVFSGSGNESAMGLTANYECLEISSSWNDSDRHKEYSNEFNLLWSDKHSDVHTVTLPEALKLKLIKFAPKEPPIYEPATALERQKAAMIWQFLIESPYLAGPAGEAACDATAMVDLWPHQRHVVEETARAWPDGRMLCDEVGMGKTIEAILIIRRLLAGRGVERVLLLVPASLLGQWQSELREKGGLVVPQLDGVNVLVWPDGRTMKVASLAEALECDLLLMSRETARTERNLPIMLASDPWDLVLLDEAHAARRRTQEEGEFNTGNLLLNLLRQLQLRRKTKGILLMSATPMQTQPWEPWDLLGTLGEGGSWLADFKGIRDFYQAIASIKAGHCNKDVANAVASLIVADKSFPPLDAIHLPTDQKAIAAKLVFVPPMKRTEIANWLRLGSPLARRMHRNTRDTLKKYYQMGLLEAPPPTRAVQDIEYNYEDKRERDVYNAITGYIERRFNELEGEKPGKGFVMTIYRRRAASSPFALKESLLRRRQGLELVIRQRVYDSEIGIGDVPEAMFDDDLPEGELEGKISASLPENPDVARHERDEIDTLLDELNALGACDSKRDNFFNILRQATDDGRPALIFTEYVDTMNYLRDSLVDFYSTRLGCYSGSGGAVWNGSEWKSVTKDTITRRLHDGELSVLLCTDAASEGLNLQAAGLVINYDLPWNPGKIEQRIGRIDRIGQKHQEVRIVNLFLKDSVDEQVYHALRDRCQLFEHFVGAMQPVLAHARRILMGTESFNMASLLAHADAVKSDLFANETYMDGTAAMTSSVQPAATRKDIEEALELLSGEFGPYARKPKGQSVIELMGLTSKKICFATSIESLEANHTVIPLSPFSSQLRELTVRLLQAGERLPLVIGTYQESGQRCSVAYWVENDEHVPIESITKLKDFVSQWDGRFPLAEQKNQVQSIATNKAQAEVRKRINFAREREKKNIALQLDACRKRLVKELGRYLVCLDGSAADLNGIFHRQLSRDIAGAHRLQKCRDRLDGYPEWSPDLCRELEIFYGELTKGQRNARLLGSELDAALDDPRWILKIKTV